MNIQLRGATNGQASPVWKIGLLVLAVVAASILLFRQAGRWSGREVWVAAQQLAEGAVVGQGDLEKVRLRSGKVPEGALGDRRRIVGKRLRQVKAAGEPFVQADLENGSRDGGSITRLVPEGRVLSTLRVPSLSIPYPELRRGDRLEIVATGRSGSGAVASDVFFVGWIKPMPTREEDDRRSGLFDLDLSSLGKEGDGDNRITLMLALHPDDVIPMARAQASNSRLSLVLHGHSEVQAGKLIELPPSRSEKVELIAGAKRAKVDVE